MLTETGWKILKAFLSKPQLAEVKVYRLLSESFGHYRSIIEQRPVDAHGDDIPWYCYPAIEFLDDLDWNGLRVLEYGSGNSSAFYSLRGALVTAIEHDEAWYHATEARLSDRLGFTIHHATEDKKYVERPELTVADLVVIDGINRVACTNYVGAQISAGLANPAMIVVDNSERYPGALNQLDDMLGWWRVDFSGFAPINSYTQATTLFLNPTRRIPRVSGLKPIGQDMTYSTIE